MLRSLFTSAVLLFCGTVVHAQLTGTIAVPSTGYPTLKEVVDSLNAKGVGTGGVIVNITANTPQTAPAGGYQLGSTTLNASTSATKTIVINGNGNTVTSFTGTSTTLDGIFFIKGVDYLTIDGLNLTESTANTTPTTAMEFGYAMVNLNGAAPFDGCQNDIIRNCTVTLNRTIATSSVGIYAGHNTSSSATALTITAAGDRHLNNKFYTNTITNVVTGILLSGFSASSPYTLYDRFNDIGGSTAATGNTITNFGAGFSNVGGITASNQDSLNIAYNVLNDTANGGAVSAITGGVWGISAAGTNSLINISNNSVIMKGASSATGNFLYGIYASTSGTNLTASNNTIYVEQPSGSSSPRYGMFLTSGNNVTALSNTVTVNTAVAGANYGIYSSYTGTLNLSANTLKLVATVSGSSTNAAIYDASAATATTISNNVFDNISINTTGSNYLIYTSNSTNTKTINGNRILGAYTNAGTSGNFYGIYNFGSPSSSTSTVNNNRFNNINLATSSTSYGIYYATGSSHNHVVTGDTVSNFTNTGSGELRGIYVAYGLLNTVTGNYVNNITGTGTVYGLYIGNTSTAASNISKNIVSALSTGSSSSVYGLYCSVTSSTTQNVFQNNISNLSATGASATLYGMYFSSAGTTTVYNNIISDIRAATASGTSPIYGMYFASGTQNNIYFNTINLAPVSTGTNFGATGLYYTSATSSAFDLRNNIIRVNALPAGTGTTVALRRSAGTAGVPPVNLAATTNGNIYWVPAATNAFLYAEGSATPLVNAFNIANDPTFNTACANYKKFMSPRETTTFTEDNLVQIAGTANYAPAGASFAKSKAVAVTTPAITVDYNNVTRATPADIGALQFTGTATLDVSAPVITYTPLPVTTYCTTPTSFTATITDASGVNNTAGTAPRVYYKKSTEANAFGGANNSTFNGWKWKEATLASGVYTFTIDYTLLNTPIASGDSITYFVIAQDNAAIPNVGTNLGALAGTCPTSVDIAAASGPLSNIPPPNGYRIVNVPSFVATSSATTPLCYSGTATLTLTPTALTSTIQWQQDNNTGVFTDIPGATGASYTTPTLTSNNNYRAQIYCGTNVIATSNFVSIFINAPTILTTTPATRCGYGTVTLGATALPNNTVSWYTAPTGGTAVATGNTFTTPPLNGTTTYYVSAKTTTPACEGTTRTPVVATVTTPTPVTVSSPQAASGICIGNSATIMATSTNTAYTYSWSSGQTTASITVSPTVTTKYIVTATDPVTNCAARDSVTINVIVPVATITAAGTTSLCPGGSVALNANTGAGFTYQWFVGNNPIPNATQASYTANATGSYTVRVYNPATTCTALSTPTVVTVNPFPPATITPAGPLNICSGNTVVLSGPTGTGYSYQWRNGANVAGGTATNATYTASTAGNYSLIVTANGCSSTSPAVSVSVLPLPATTMTPNTATTGCDSVVLATADTAVGYQWNYNGSPIIGANSRTYAAQVSGNYSLTNTSNANGCTATTPNVAITVNPSPAGLITYATPLTFCEGGAVVLNTFTGQNFAYQWLNANDTITGATGPNYVVTASGTYTVRVVNTATGCSRIANPLIIRVHPKPQPVVTYNVPMNTLSTTTPYVQYQWLNNAVPIAGATRSTYVPLANGAYTVRVIDTNGCTNLSDVVFVNSVGVSRTPAGAAIRIYPNPTSSVLYVKSPEAVSLKLVDVTGKVVMAAANATELDLEKIADGMYLLYVTDGSGQLIRAEKVTKSTH